MNLGLPQGHQETAQTLDIHIVSCSSTYQGLHGYPHDPLPQNGATDTVIALSDNTGQGHQHGLQRKCAVGINMVSGGSTDLGLWR